MRKKTVKPPWRCSVRAKQHASDSSKQPTPRVEWPTRGGSTTLLAMLIFALLGAAIVGLALGLMGSSGSILAVPVLVYIVGQDEKVAIAGSMGIVAAISAIAAIPYARRGLVAWRSVLWFGLPGMAGAWIGAAASQHVSGAVQLSVFAALMLLAAYMMLRPARETTGGAPRPAGLVVVDGLVVGAVTGFVGVGGGFLIVPALVLLGGLEMRRAVATSLLVIALKSAVGFTKHLEVLGALGLKLDWQIVLLFIAAGVAGSYGGSILSTRIPQAALKRAFGVFLLVMGAAIVAQNWSRVIA